MLSVVVIIMGVVCSLCIIKMRMMQEQIEKLKKSSVMKTAFLTKFNKELHNPLQNINKQAAILTRQDVCLSKSEKKLICDQITYYTNLISTYLEECVLLVNGGKGHKVEKEEFNPNLLCIKCINAIKNNSEMSDKVKVLFNTELRNDDFTKSDPHIVELILDELLVNACRFTKEGEIRVKSARTEIGDRFVIIVENTGASMPADRLPHLFHWFENPDPNRDDAEIDLSIIYKLALKINGYLEYDPLFNEGVRMRFIF